MNGEEDSLIFAGLGRAEILRLTFQAEVEGKDACCDLVVKTNGLVRSFHFIKPQDVQVQSHTDIGWLQIFNVKGRGLSGLGVLVMDGEQSEAIHFYAQSVVEVSQ